MFQAVIIPLFFIFSFFWGPEQSVVVMLRKVIRYCTLLSWRKQNTGIISKYVLINHKRAHCVYYIIRKYMESKLVSIAINALQFTTLQQLLYDNSCFLQKDKGMTAVGIMQLGKKLCILDTYTATTTVLIIARLHYTC